MSATPRYYRLRVHDGVADVAFFEDPAFALGNVLNISSVPTDDAPYLAADGTEVVHGDGLGVDLLEGSMEVGEYHVQVIDVETGTPDVVVAGHDFADFDQVAAWNANTTANGAPATWGTGIGGVGDGQHLAASFTNVELPEAMGGFLSWFTYEVPNGLYVVSLDARHTGITQEVEDLRYEWRVPGSDWMAIGSGTGDNAAYWNFSTVTDGTLTVEVRFVVEARESDGFLSYFADLYLDNVVIASAGTGVERIVTRELATLDLTDGSTPWALLSRRAAIEWSEDALTAETPTWQTLTLGYVNRLTLSGGLVWDFTIGDTRRAELRQELFRTAPAPAITDASALLTGGGDVLTSPVHLVGGPIYGGAAWGTPERNVFAGVEDFGPVRLEVVDLTGAGERVLCLQGGSGLGGYLAPYYAALYTEALADEAAATLLYARDFFVPDRETWASDAGQDVTTYGYFPSLVAQLTDVTTGDVVYTVPIAAPTRRAGSYPLNGGRSDPNDPIGTYDALLEKSARMLRVDWNTTTLGTKPAAGTEFDVRVYPATVSARWPLHEKGHPVDLVVRWWEARGIRYDADAAATIRAGIDTIYGGAVEVELTWDQATKLGAYAPQLLSYFGAGVRCDAAGKLQMYGVRHSIGGGQTVTLADLRATDVETFDLDEAQIATRADTKTRAYLFTRATEALKSADDVPPNNLRTTWQTVQGAADATVQDDDERTHVWEIPGRVLINGVAQDPVRLAQPAGDWLVRWRKRGAPELDLKVLPAITARAGDWITLDLPHLPIPFPDGRPVTQRGQGLQAAVVLRRTEVVGGADLRVVFAPPADQEPLAAPATGNGTDDGVVGLPPTFTLAAAAEDPTRVARVTITNADDLAALGALTSWEYKTGASEPTVAGIAYGPVDPSADAVFDLPPVTTGATVWVRGRSSGIAAGISAWTARQSLNLSLLVADVVADFGSGDEAVLADFGSGDDYVRAAF